MMGSSRIRRKGSHQEQTISFPYGHFILACETLLLLRMPIALLSFFKVKVKGNTVKKWDRIWHWQWQISFPITKQPTSNMSSLDHVGKVLWEKWYWDSCLVLWLLIICSFVAWGSVIITQFILRDGFKSCWDKEYFEGECFIKFIMKDYSYNFTSFLAPPPTNLWILSKCESVICFK
jgi:hypothetical protein